MGSRKDRYGGSQEAAGHGCYGESVVSGCLQWNPEQYFFPQRASLHSRDDSMFP